MRQRDGLSAGDIAGATRQLCGREAYTVPSPVDVPAQGGRRVINVTAPTFCPGWTAEGNIITAGFGPTVGNGSVSIDVPQNHGPLTVFYTLTIARKSIQVRVPVFGPLQSWAGWITVTSSRTLTSESKSVDQRCEFPLHAAIANRRFILPASDLIPSARSLDEPPSSGRRRRASQLHRAPLSDLRLDHTTPTACPP